MIVDAHVGWDTNGYFWTRPCGIGNVVENKGSAPPGGGTLRVFCDRIYRERWLMNDSSAILLFWSGKSSQPRM